MIRHCTFADVAAEREGWKCASDLQMQMRRGRVNARIAERWCFLLMESSQRNARFAERSWVAALLRQGRQNRWGMLRRRLQQTPLFRERHRRLGRHLCQQRNKEALLLKTRFIKEEGDSNGGGLENRY